MATVAAAATTTATAAAAAPVLDVSVAITPNDMAAVPRLLKEIAAGVEALKDGGDEARHDLIIKTRSMVQALETPREAMIMHSAAQTAVGSCLLWGAECGLWRLMVENGDRPQTVAELAEALGVDPALLRRVMRHIGAMGHLVETAEDEYRPTNFSKSMSLSILTGGYYFLLPSTGVAHSKFHEFSRKSGWRNPTDAADTPLMYAYGTNVGLYEFARSAGFDHHFNDHMAVYREGRIPWMHPDFFSVRDRLVSGARREPDAAFLVDIGGNLGHDLAEFVRYHPNTPGRLILQDLPDVVGAIQTLDPAIERMPYDFMTEQPVKDARAYFVHSILHNWPDDACAKILARIKEAMRPGYSRLLINEHVIPPTGAHWEASAMDINMMTLLSSRERTERDWHHLLEEVAGLRIIRIWSAGQPVESVIEAERVE